MAEAADDPAAGRNGRGGLAVSRRGGRRRGRRGGGAGGGGGGWAGGGRGGGRAPAGLVVGDATGALAEDADQEVGAIEEHLASESAHDAGSILLGGGATRPAGAGTVAALFPIAYRSQPAAIPQAVLRAYAYATVR